MSVLALLMLILMLVRQGLGWCWEAALVGYGVAGDGVFLQRVLMPGQSGGLVLTPVPVPVLFPGEWEMMVGSGGGQRLAAEVVGWL